MSELEETIKDIDSHKNEYWKKRNEGYDRRKDSKTRFLKGVVSFLFVAVPVSALQFG